MIAFVHHPARDEFGDLGMVEDRLVEHAGVFQSPPHDFRIGDGGLGIGEPDRPGFHELPDLREFLARVIFGDGPQGEDVAMPGPLGLEQNKLRRGAGIDDGRRIRHAGHAGKPARQGRRRPGEGGFIVFVPRFAEGDVRIDQTGANDEAAWHRSGFRPSRRKKEAHRSPRPCPARISKSPTRSMFCEGSMIRPPVIKIVPIVVIPGERGASAPWLRGVLQKLSCDWLE